MAIVMVVVGHWLLMDVVRTPAGLTGESALGYLSDVQWLTWIFQVMPVFFLVGGVSNAISWSKHRQRAVQAGDSTGSVANWLLGRSGRVFTPLTLLLVLMAVSALTARQIGVNDYDVAQAVSVVVLPLWFLVVYLAVVLLTPAMFRLHERFGLWVVLACVVGVAIGDVLRFSTGIEYTAGANFAFAWLGVHQVGFSWFDGRLRLSSQRAGALAAGGLATALLLVGPGPYPVSMVSVPGAEIQNSGPPSLALVALATAQIGLAVLVSGPAERWLARSR
ncbi:MAG: acyltransferase family protein, partial [Promicromonosporaceae bacterium]|nr:acyltransferase family protein [Promicromonosporaceae bacterium]